jgi:phosphoglucosamine mutase
VTKRTPIEELPTLVAAIREAEEDFAGNGRVLIRYSGTESVARVMVEGNDAAKVSRVAEALADELRRALGGS